MRFIRAHKPLLLLIAFIAFGLVACVRKPAVSESEKELLRAVQHGDYESAAYCLDMGVSPDITDIYGQSLLMLAVQDEYKDVIGLLLSKGADVNYKINTRNTEGIQNVRNINTELSGLNVLYFAVQTGDTTIVDMLLKRGAELNPENESESPLLIASENLDYEMLGYLFRNKARVSDRIAWDIYPAVQ